MAQLKLGKLPERTPVKLSIAIMPNLYQRLVDYAATYRDAYGIEEQIADLVPAMLNAFLDSDRAFAAANRTEGKS